MEEFKVSKKYVTPNFSNEIKTNVIEIMSKFMNLKLNVNKMLPKIKIKKI